MQRASPVDVALFSRGTVKMDAIPTYVICLEKKREERCDANFASIQRVFPKAEWTSAVVGSTIRPDEDPRVSVHARHHVKHKTDLDASHLTTTGALGCYLSHVNLWKRIAESGRPGVVVEDDMLLSDWMAERLRAIVPKIPERADFVGLIHIPWPFSQAKQTKYNEDFYRIDTRYFAGTQMYYLTPRGALALLHHAFPIVSQVDVLISYVASTEPAFVGLFPKEDLYMLIPFLRDNMSSTLSHRPSIKKLLPDTNWFYGSTFALLVALLAATIVLLHLRRK